MVVKAHKFQMESAGHPRRQSDRKRRHPRIIVPPGFWKRGNWIRWIVRIPNINLAAAKPLSGNDVECQHVAGIETDAVGRGLLIENSRRIRKRPYFGGCCLNELSDEVVGLP